VLCLSSRLPRANKQPTCDSNDHASVKQTPSARLEPDQTRANSSTIPQATSRSRLAAPQQPYYACHANHRPSSSHTPHHMNVSSPLSPLVEAALPHTPYIRHKYPRPNIPPSYLTST
jgi:hypothetical protein